MANTYNSTISRWSRISTALRLFAVSIATAVTDFARYVVRHVVGWVRRAAGRPYLALAEREPLAGLNARESCHLRAAKRGRPTVMPRWRMCASV
ncbi:hypothetical protein ACUXAV_000666 [Cupriavidus metallidurans]|uniref:hypothetical protein n=1 Tax=Cupriavidus metallidurans TaxID=119219 RepID=UPI00049349D5|nr:hypothetical protein [Cupriavidus metallidurans]MDE4918567.1 hypothetical protein [Cupriavidus metallidurans]